MEAFIKDWLASWNGNNPEKLLSFYHPDAFYSDPAFPQGLKGKEAIGGYFRKLLARYPSWNWEMIHIDQVSSTRYYVKWKATFMNGHQEYGLDLVEIKDKLLIRNEVYFDPRKM